MVTGLYAQPADSGPPSAASLQRLSDAMYASRLSKIFSAGAQARAAGAPADAARAFALARGIVSRGPEASRVGDELVVLEQLVASWLDAGQPAEALEPARRWVAATGAALGEISPEHVRAQQHLGTVHLELDDPTSALDALSRALQISRALHGPQGLGQAPILLGISRARRLRGEVPAARTAVDEALRLLKTRHGEAHPFVREARRELARVRLAEEATERRTR